MTFIQKSLAAAALATFSVLTHAGMLSLTPSSDESVSVNYGIYTDAPQLTINWVPVTANVGLLQFDLTGIASAASASLDLFHQYNKTNATFGIFRNTSAWVGVTTDWASRPAYDTTPVDTLTLGGNDMPGVYRSFDVTSAVQGWISGATQNYGFTLARIDDTSNPYIYFSATESGPNMAPRLNITAVPEPTSVAMLLGGLAVVAASAVRRHKQG